MESASRPPVSPYPGQPRCNRPGGPKYLVSWHQPLNGVDSYGVKDRNLMHRLSQGLDLPIRYLDFHGSCHGTMTGWYNSRHPARRSRWSTAPAHGRCGR